MIDVQLMEPDDICLRYRKNLMDFDRGIKSLHFVPNIMQLSTN